jgi:hypothetical protein
VRSARPTCFFYCNVAARTSRSDTRFDRQCRPAGVSPRPAAVPRTKAGPRPGLPRAQTDTAPMNQAMARVSARADPSAASPRRARDETTLPSLAPSSLLPVSHRRPDRLRLPSRSRKGHPPSTHSPWTRRANPLPVGARPPPRLPSTHAECWTSLERARGRGPGLPLRGLRPHVGVRIRARAPLRVPGACAGTCNPLIV